MVPEKTNFYSFAARTRTQVNPVTPKINQMMRAGGWSSISSVHITNTNRAISDQITITGGRRRTITRRESNSTVKILASEGPPKLLPQMCVDGAGRRRLPEESLPDRCRRCLGSIGGVMATGELAQWQEASRTVMALEKLTYDPKQHRD